MLINILSKMPFIRTIMDWFNLTEFLNINNNASLLTSKKDEAKKRTTKCDWRNSDIFR